MPRNITEGLEREHNCCGWDKTTDDPDCAVVSTTPCGPIIVRTLALDVNTRTHAAVYQIEIFSKPLFVVGGVLVALGIIYTLVFIFTALYARRMKKRETDGYAEVF